MPTLPPDVILILSEPSGIKRIKSETLLPSINVPVSPKAKPYPESTRA